MRMRGKGLMLVAGLVGVIDSASADAWNIAVAPSVDLTFKKTDFSVDSSGGGGNQLIQPTYNTLTPSLAMSFGPLYAVAAYEMTINDWNSESIAVGLTSASMTLDKYERNEASFTLGYKVFSGSKNIGSVNAFLGYLNGRSTWNTSTFLTDWTAPPTVYSFSVERYVFSEDGFYVGANYSHPFGEKGVLAVNTAFALLNGNLNWLSADGENWDYLSDATGYSLGLTWTGPITGNVNYRVGVKYVDYNFNIKKFRDNNTGAVTIVPSSFNLSLKEEVHSLFIGVSAYF